MSKRKEHRQISSYGQIKIKQVCEITVTDPDSKLPVEVTIFKAETGGLFGVDSSFLMNTDEPIWSPFDCAVSCDEEVSQ